MTTTTTRLPGRNTFDSSNTRYTIERILEAFAKPQTYAELANSLHMSDRSVRRYILHLRSAPNRRVRIESYSFVWNVHVPIFALGSRPDALKPSRSEAEKRTRWREKVARTPELKDREQRHAKARWAVQKATTVPQTPFSALFVGRVASVNAEG